MSSSLLRKLFGRHLIRPAQKLLHLKKPLLFKQALTRQLTQRAFTVTTMAKYQRQDEDKHHQSRYGYRRMLIYGGIAAGTASLLLAGSYRQLVAD